MSREDFIEKVTDAARGNISWEGEFDGISFRKDLMELLDEYFFIDGPFTKKPPITTPLTGKNESV